MVVILIKSLQPKNKTEKEIQKATSELPNIYLHSKDMGGLIKTLNFAFDNSLILQYFAYENGVVTLKMKDGTTMKAPLDKMEVRYDTSSKMVKMKIKAYDKIVKISSYDNFREREWEIIFRVLALSRTTYGTNLLLGNYSNPRYNVQKILQRLN